MIPLLAKVGVSNQSGFGFRIWIPLFLVWLLLLPIAVLLLPVILVVWLVGQLNPFRALAVGWEILSSLRRTHVEVENHNTSVLIHIV